LGLLACTLAAVLMGSTPGVKYMDTVVQDDAVFLHSSPAQVQAAARQLRALGATYLRVTAGWSVIAPAPRATRRPSFDAADPGDYRDGFKALDTAVRAAAAAGLKVEIDIGFWAPRWAVAHGSSTPDRERYYPDARQFGKFAAAVARRYSGTFYGLPAVRMFVPWNEPNHPAFLLPQWKRARPIAADVYRGMYLAAHDAIKAVQPDAQVLIGNLAATTRDAIGHGGIAPLRFLRELTCVDDALNPLPTRACARYRPLAADGIAMHPYSNHFGAPGAESPSPDDAPIADTARVTALLSQLAARGRIASVWPVYDTEYGYETSPPDPFQTTTPEQQAQYLGQASYLAWKDPSTRMFAQFELRDVDPTTGRRAHFSKASRAYWADYQSGLYYDDGRPKPAATAFQLPFWAQREQQGAGQAVMLWGMVRPGKDRRVVRFERRDPATGAWTPVQTYGPACAIEPAASYTDTAGVVTAFVPWVGPSTYRMSWLRPDDTWLPGAPVAVG
jgi:Cellulase (glycosyl hydrolase family 5)